MELTEKADVENVGLFGADDAVIVVHGVVVHPPVRD